MRQSHHRAAEKGQMAGATSRLLPMITAGEPVPADINHTLSLQRGVRAGLPGCAALPC